MTDSSVAKATGAAEPIGQNQARRRYTLRAQGFILLGVGIALVLSYGAFIVRQREMLESHYMKVESQQNREEELVRIGYILFRVDREIDESLTRSDPASAVPVISSYFAPIHLKPSAALSSYSTLDAPLKRMKGTIDTLQDGNVRANLENLGRDIHELSAELDSVIEHVAKHRSNLSAEHLQIFYNVTLTSAIVSILALGGFGAFIIHFFKRLTTAIKVLRTRAREIQAGWYSAPLIVDRGDEVGELMDAMNKMAATLQQRDKDLAISRQQYFHEEKMTAVKSLAAGVAHEIGNPLETISLVAQAIVDAKDKCCESKGVHCNPQLILDQTRRIGRITREISNFTTPSVPDSRPQNLNELIRGISNFIRYDRRYRLTELALELDPRIPAVFLVADQFTQVILNLLINAADACESCGNGTAQVVVRTERLDAGVGVRVIDNGCGMDQDTLNHAFDAFYTTKSSDRGSGLGLVVCKSIIEASGGTMRLTSEEQIGTSVEIFLPAG